MMPLQKVDIHIGKRHWRDFHKHENSASHHEAVDLLVTIPNSTSDVGEMLSSALAEEKALEDMQGLPLRGHYKSGGISDENGEIDSNFLQFLKGRAEDDEGLQKMVDKEPMQIYQSRCEG